MNILKNLFLSRKKSENNKVSSPGLVDKYIEIAELVKEARIQQNLTVKELSYIVLPTGTPIWKSAFFVMDR